MKVDDLLDAAAPADDWAPSWGDVLDRSVRPAEARPRRGVLIVALAVVLAAAAVVPLIAVGASNSWWFLKHSVGADRPTRVPVIVKEGRFGENRWKLVAFPAADGLCWSLTFTASAASGGGAGLACGPVTGFPSAHGNPQMPITYLASAGWPGWITGPVIPKAVIVRVQYARGTIQTSTFAAPSALGTLRFYAAEVPHRLTSTAPPTTGGRPPQPLRWLAGYDAQGRIVACLDPAEAIDGISPMSACR